MKKSLVCGKMCISRYSKALFYLEKRAEYACEVKKGFFSVKLADKE